MSKNKIFSNYMRSPEMIACGLSLAHRAKYGKLKSRIMVLTGKGLFGLSRQDMGAPSGSGLKRDPGPEMTVSRRALKFRF